MLVNEEDFDALVEAVDNSQMRLADTYMLRVIAQLLDSVEEISEKVNHMYEFLSSEDEVENPIEKQEATNDIKVSEENNQDTAVAKQSNKTKRTVEEQKESKDSE